MNIANNEVLSILKLKKCDKLYMNVNRIIKIHTTKFRIN